MNDLGPLALFRLDGKVAIVTGAVLHVDGGWTAV